MSKKIAVCLGAFLAAWLNVSHADDSLMKAKALIEKGQEQNNIALLREAVALLEPAVKRRTSARSLSSAGYMPMGVMTLATSRKHSR
ncbi:hypothetical protein P5G63_21375 [Aeromonas salmonicida]|nr:hypothetical protein [Aeromonas salmonicida]MDF8330899.1 hypothetical protein [Aeromonas salmonicida]